MGKCFWLAITVAVLFGQPVAKVVDSANRVLPSNGFRWGSDNLLPVLGENQTAKSLGHSSDAFFSDPRGAVDANITSFLCGHTLDELPTLEDQVFVDVGHELFHTYSGLVLNIPYSVRVRAPPGIGDTHVLEISSGWLEYSDPRRYFRCNTNNDTLRLIFTEGQLNLTWILSRLPSSRRVYFRFEVYSQASKKLLHSSTSWYQVLEDCSLRVATSHGLLLRTHLPSANSGQCTVTFNSGAEKSLHFSLRKLKLACPQRLEWGILSSGQVNRKFCGKLHDYSSSQRDWQIHGQSLFIRFNTWALATAAFFAVRFQTKTPCAGLVFTEPGTVLRLVRSDFVEDECRFSVHFPFGYRVELHIQANDSHHALVDDDTETASNEVVSGHNELLMNADKAACFLLAQVEHAAATRSECFKQTLTFPAQSSYVQFKATLFNSSRNVENVELNVTINAVGDPMTTEGCDFSWVAVDNTTCVSARDEQLPWQDGENKCRQAGGHLVTIKDQHMQDFIQNLLSSAFLEPSLGFWIGASDRRQETVFEWNSGAPFTYSNWFPGWDHLQHYNGQPSDDGFSGQDCVEMRQTFSQPNKELIPVKDFFWNDRDCFVPNYFVCEKPRAPVLERNRLESSDCNRTVQLSRENPSAVIRSPNYPLTYPESIRCTISITAPIDYLIILNFEHFDIEDEEDCTYDYVEVSDALNRTNLRQCGNWNTRLKLLHTRSFTNKLEIHFASDNSYSGTGFQMTASLEKNRISCPESRSLPHNGYCYLIVPYPEVKWHVAYQACHSLQGELALVEDEKEAAYLQASLATDDFNSTPFYWIGRETRLKFILSFGNSTGGLGEFCPVLCTTTPTAKNQTSQPCNRTAGYICKRSLNNQPVARNFTVEAAQGEIKSPNYPQPYSDNVHFRLHIKTPKKSGSERILIHFIHVDLEYQGDCLYDYVGIQFKENGPVIKICRLDHLDSNRLFVSPSNEVWLIFHSDYSVTDKGFHAVWNTTDLQGCPRQLFTNSSGIVRTPSLQSKHLTNLDCHYEIAAPEGHRIYVEFTSFSVGKRPCKDDYVRLWNGGESNIYCGAYNLTTYSLRFLSHGTQLSIHLKTGDSRHAERHFYATYRFVAAGENLVESISIPPSPTNFFLTPVNYPMTLPVGILHHVLLTASPGYNLRLQGSRANHGSPANSSCLDDPSAVEIADFYRRVYAADTWGPLCPNQSNTNSFQVLTYFHSVRVTYAYDHHPHGAANRTLHVQALPDADFNDKLRAAGRNRTIESCETDLCENNGVCISDDNASYCNCTSDWKGLFCSLSTCEWSPCVHGSCRVDNGTQRCICDAGYSGALCDTALLPCDIDPCQGHGDCINVGTGFQCNCHAWWQGPRCETRWFQIPYKPLSQRMLEEPFWLGLITIGAVLVLIGLVWCIRRNFPEKLERFVLDDAERGKLVDQSPGDWSRHRSSFHRSSLEPMLGTNNNLAQVHNTNYSGGLSEPSANSRTFMSRLSLRKPSLLSITSLLSPNQAGASCNNTDRTRTFSLDDLFRIPKRSPSPSKIRSSDVDVASKQREAERHQLLQRLISPRLSQFDFSSTAETMNNICPERRSLTQFLSSENGQSTDNETIAETSFTCRLEKRVTFARMLNRVSTEISSSASDLSGIEDSKTREQKVVPESRFSHRRKGRNWNARKLWRMPHSNSSTQGSASDLEAADRDLSSTDSVSQPTRERRNLRLLKLPGRSPKEKYSSSESIKALFRNFSSSKSPSTPSSPQGSDADASSAFPTPLSTPGTPNHSAESPRQPNTDNTIQVTVLDAVNSQRNTRTSASSGPFITLEIPAQNYGRFLSPIREVPSPLPSPAHNSGMPGRCVTHARSRSSEDETSTDSSKTCPSVTVTLTNDDMKAKLTLKKSTEDFVPSPVSPRQKPPPLKIIDSNFTRFEKMELAKKEQPQLSFPVIPVFCISEPSPLEERISVDAKSEDVSKKGQPTWGQVTIGSPPLRKQIDHLPLTNEVFSRKILKGMSDKSNSLDLPNAPPMITITANFSEAESDSENALGGGSMSSNGQSTMCYLSPYVCFGARNDMAASESNLSSSGYSSMASPGPSPCVSSKTLCCSESDEMSVPMRRRFKERQLFRRALSPSLESSSPPPDSPCKFALDTRILPSDSEITDDQLMMEHPTDPESAHEDSIDEGLGIDHIRKKIDDGEVRSAKELECFMAASSPTDSNNFLNIARVQKSKSLDSKVSSQPHWIKLKSDSLDTKLMSLTAPVNFSRTLQKPDYLPVNCLDINDDADKKKSPVSSRSESPLSDAKSAGLSRFSTHFYGKTRADLPYTDSDGLYDCPSSESKLPISLAVKRNARKSERRRERKAANTHGTKCASLLDPAIDKWRLSTPKRRYRAQPLPNTCTTSSSSESLTLSARKSPPRRNLQTKVTNLECDPSPTCDVVLTIQGATSADDSASEVSSTKTDRREAQQSSETHRVVKLKARRRYFGHQTTFPRPWRKHETFSRWREQLPLAASRFKPVEIPKPSNPTLESFGRRESSSSCFTDSDIHDSNDSLADLAEPEDSPESPRDEQSAFVNSPT